MSDNYRLLLAEAARLYEKHGAGRPEPFNVFSVLHKETDEVNLHSRFLHALLDYKKPWTETRENLKDFLQYVAKISDFELYDVEVKRERYNIDILITNADKKAVVIENKTNPNRGDEDKQLWRYYKTLKRQRYLHSNIHLLYLTLDGHDPSPESLGKLKKEKIIKIAYKDNLLQTWLERCQKRAYDEPALRESVAQYLYLITKLTGTNYSEAYMNDLKNLCLKEDNLVLVYDLNKAMEEARISLLNKLWQEIACKLREEIPDLLDLSEEDLDISEERIRRFVTYQTNYRYHGIYYKFSLKFSLHAFLFVEVEDSIYFGVKCPKEENKDEYNRLKEALEEVPGRSYKSYLWYQYVSDLNLNVPDLNLKYPTREHLKRLVNEDERQKYVKAVVSGVGDVWKRIKGDGLA